MPLAPPVITATCPGSIRTAELLPLPGRHAYQMTANLSETDRPKSASRTPPPSRDRHPRRYSRWPQSRVERMRDLQYFHGFKAMIDSGQPVDLEEPESSGCETLWS
jgi:hypothetical protein